MVITIRTIMVLLIALKVFNNTMMIQNNKTIDVLGSSYTQEEISSDQSEDSVGNIFNYDSDTKTLFSRIIAQMNLILNPDEERTQTTEPVNSEQSVSETSTTVNTTVAGSSDYYVKTYKITYYCSCSKCNPGNTGRTASGKALELGMVAMRGVPFGTIVEINGEKYVVEDRCASNKIIDIYVSSHSEALQKGTYIAQVKIYK